MWSLSWMRTCLSLGWSRMKGCFISCSVVGLWLWFFTRQLSMKDWNFLDLAKDRKGRYREKQVNISILILESEKPVGIWEDPLAATQFLLRCTLPRGFPRPLCWCLALSQSCTITCVLSSSFYTRSYPGGIRRKHHLDESGESWERSVWLGNHQSHKWQPRKCKAVFLLPFLLPCETAGRNERQCIQI